MTPPLKIDPYALATRLGAALSRFFSRVQVTCGQCRDRLLWRRLCGLKLFDLAREAEMSNYGVVATNVRRYKVRLDRDRAEKSRVAQILKLFNCEMGDPVRLSLLVSANEDGTVKL